MSLPRANLRDVRGHTLTDALRPPSCLCRNIGEVYTHLTNYSLNKASENFEDTAEDSTGSKRKISWVRRRLQEEGHDADKIFAQVGVHSFLQGLDDTCMDHAVRA